MRTNQPPPWARGPFELIKHALGHLESKDDTDRRIALIGFDNAIEVCIDVFIRLHPKLRKGIALEHEEVDKATKNYHTKIEWLDKYIEKNNIDSRISLEELVWYHSLRNELYHSGNGMVPEMHALYGIRDNAILVFSTLFQLDVSKLLGKSVLTVETFNVNYPETIGNKEMEFLRLYIEFEKVLDDLIVSDTVNSKSKPITITNKLAQLKQAKKIPPEWNSIIDKTRVLRNQIVHGQSNHLTEEEIFDLSHSLVGITEEIGKLKSDFSA